MGIRLGDELEGRTFATVNVRTCHDPCGRVSVVCPENCETQVDATSQNCQRIHTCYGDVHSCCMPRHRTRQKWGTFFWQ
jgi:hypothetical protein